MKTWVAVVAVFLWGRSVGGAQVERGPLRRSSEMHPSRSFPAGQKQVALPARREPRNYARGGAKTTRFDHALSRRTRPRSRSAGLSEMSVRRYAIGPATSER